MNTRDYKIDYLTRLRNPRYARGMLKVAFEECLEDGKWQVFGLLLQDVVEAQGSKQDFAKKSKLSRAHLYRLFAATANPTIETLIPVLAQLGLRLCLAERDR